VRFQVAKRVGRVDAVELEGQAELGLEDGLGAHEQLDAGGQRRTGGALELGDDAGGGARPDPGLRLGHDPAGGVPLAQLQVDVAFLSGDAQDFDDGPNAGAVGGGDSRGDTGEQAGQGDAAGGEIEGGGGRRGRKVDRGRRGLDCSGQPGPEWREVPALRHEPLAFGAVPARTEGLDLVLLLERDGQEGGGHGGIVSEGGAGSGTAPSGSAQAEILRREAVSADGAFDPADGLDRFTALGLLSRNLERLDLCDQFGIAGDVVHQQGRSHRRLV
jgi:hypothetical protein